MLDISTLHFVSSLGWTLLNTGWHRQARHGTTNFVPTLKTFWSQGVGGSLEGDTVSAVQFSTAHCSRSVEPQWRLGRHEVPRRAALLPMDVLFAFLWNCSFLVGCQAGSSTSAGVPRPEKSMDKESDTLAQELVTVDDPIASCSPWIWSSLVAPSACAH